MPDPTERGRKPDIPQNKQVIRHLLAVERITINPQDETICALVPVSIQLVDRMLRTGHLVQRSGALSDFSHNRLAVQTTPSLFSRLVDIQTTEEVGRLLFDPEENLAYAKIKAKDAGSIHHFITQLGLSIDDNNLYEKVAGYLFAIDELTDPFPGRSQDANAQQEIDAAADLFPLLPVDALGTLRNLADQACERKGFIVAINAEAAFTIHGVVEGSDQDLEISFGPQGMPYLLIAAIQPMGPYEERFLEELRNNA